MDLWGGVFGLAICVRPPVLPQLCYGRFELCLMARDMEDAAHLLTLLLAGRDANGPRSVDLECLTVPVGVRGEGPEDPLVGLEGQAEPLALLSL
eukprot:15334456-Alexandrium_andersonii.AAC.1